MKTSHVKPMIGLAAMLLAATPTLNSPAHAFSSSDADTIFNAFNSAFYSNVGHNGNWYYKADNQSGTTGSGWWTYAEEIEMAEDAYDRTKSSGAKTIVTNLCNDFVYQYGTLWTTSNKFNDDVAWATIAFARAYQITGNTTFRDCARNNFDSMYNRAWDGALGGGLWWTTDKTCKNACINGPGAIAAFLIYQNGGGASYYDKANAIYNWEWNNLYNPSTGQVYDNKNSSGVLTNWVFSYNLGTFIGAADYLNHPNDAMMAANCAKNTLCTNGILPDASPGDAAGFNGIFMRWTAKYMKDYGTESTFLPWLQANANAAWNVRRSDNLSWNNWRSGTPGGTLAAWSCANSVVALQVVPPDAVTIAGTHTIVSWGNGNAIDNASSNSQPSGIIQWQYNGGAAQQWTFTQNSDTSWCIVSQFSGKALDNGNSFGNGTQIIQWSLDTNNNNQRWWVDRQPDGTYKIWNKANSLSLDNGNKSGNNIPLIQWAWSGGYQQRWLLF